MEIQDKGVSSRMAMDMQARVNSRVIPMGRKSFGLFISLEIGNFEPRGGSEIWEEAMDSGEESSVPLSLLSVNRLYSSSEESDAECTGLILLNQLRREKVLLGFLVAFFFLLLLLFSDRA